MLRMRDAHVSIELLFTAILWPFESGGAAVDTRIPIEFVTGMLRADTTWQSCIERIEHAEC